ncbi:hypothetical protein PR202_gb21116 [Eleusine coracana subsp. coracana]|uniref:X8 domain-containing protein n=1 Tax=Eleusine coracana subsp. coracana TaxID=191504 RepID=A0AAV5FCB3_ELECO|nr:hypothetical protein PR202_gb21116 [Eleusine coracana subsp. coracana]
MGWDSSACDFAGAASIVNQQPADTCGKTAASWCVANSAVSDARLQAALDYACSNGADCGAIQKGGSCFEPNTKVAHASYAFNSYYQRKGRVTGMCDFSSAASVVSQAPSEFMLLWLLPAAHVLAVLIFVLFLSTAEFGNCVFPSNG